MDIVGSAIGSTVRVVDGDSTTAEGLGVVAGLSETDLRSLDPPHATTKSIVNTAGTKAPRIANHLHSQPDI
jgi:hypothetical protein